MSNRPDGQDDRRIYATVVSGGSWDEVHGEQLLV
jgi:hypothetical protein